MVSLTVIIPAYNEEKTILQIIEKLLAALDSKIPQVQYIIVDDGSRDATKKILQESRYTKDRRFTIIYQEKNTGKGSAIRSALPHAHGDFIIIQDADLEYHPEDIVKLFTYASIHQSAVVYGSRNLSPETPHGSFMFYWGGRFLSGLTNILFNQKLTDEACGYKLFSSELIKSLPLTCRKFEFCPEVTALIAKKGILIPEIAVNYTPRSKHEGKKIRYADGMSAITTLLRLRFSLGNKIVYAFFIFLFVFGIFFFTWNGSVSGYEPDTIDAAVALSNGDYLLKKPAIGSSILYLPFVYVSRMLPSSQIYNFLTLVPPLYSALTMAIFFLIAVKLGMRKSISETVTMLIAFGSLVWPYSKIGMEYQEMFLISLIILTLLYWKKESPIISLLIGTEVALLTLAKSYGIVFIVPTLVFIFTKLYQEKNARGFFKASLLVRLVGPTVLTLFCIILINMLLAGRLSGAYTVGDEFQIVSWWEGVWGIFFGFGKSVLVYSPLLIPSIFFWPRFFKKFRALSLFILIGFAFYFIITAPFSYWSDETPSVRKLIPFIPFLHLPLYVGIDFLLEQKKKFLLATICVICVIAVYVQFVNSIYPYYRYMNIIGGSNADTLVQMRYNPQISQLYINHRLFLSYLQKHFTGVTGQYTYIEKTWMRHYKYPGEKDLQIAGFTLDLDKSNIPSIYFYNAENKQVRNYFLAGDVLLLTITGLFLVFTTATCYKQEFNKAI